MKIEVTDVSGLPEWLQSHVSEGQLDLSAIPAPEDVSGLKSALQKERANVSEYSKYGTPEEIAQRIADLTKQAQSGGKGAEEAQAKIDALMEKHTAAIADRDARIDRLMKTSVSGSLKAELTKAGFVPEAIDDIAASAMSRIAFNEDGSPKITTADGKPMLGSGDGHNATLADLAKELAESKPYAVRDQGKGGGGKPPGSNGGTPNKPNPLADIPGFSDLPEK